MCTINVLLKHSFGANRVDLVKEHFKLLEALAERGVVRVPLRRVTQDLGEKQGIAGHTLERGDQKCW